jgi:hypothetical protein
MDHQLQFNFSAEELRDKGISQAEDHANRDYFGWSEQAYSFLVTFARMNPVFQAEDVRGAAEGIVPQPPSERAWGGVIVRARKEGLIERTGYAPVKNPKAHKTPAAVWKYKA